MSVELPGNIPVGIQQHPCVVLAHPNAQRCVGCFAKFVFELRRYTAPYRTLSGSATKVAQVLAERNEARLRCISEALQPAREIGICGFEGVFCVVCSMLVHREDAAALPACFVSTRFNMPRQGSQGYSHSLSSPLNVLHPAYHNGSEILKLFPAGARATQYGCAIRHAGAMELLNSCRSECGIPANFHVRGQSKKNESPGPKTKTISGIVASSAGRRAQCW